MSTIKTNAILDSAGGNTATINGITPALASQAEAQAGTNNTNLMTPLRVEEAILSNLNVTGAAPTYACRAWVNFAGASGTTRGSGNVSSVSRTAAGSYTVNFATAMPDVNYCITGVSSGSSSGSTSISMDGASGDFTRSVGSVTLQSVDASGNASVDAATVCVAIFR